MANGARAPKACPNATTRARQFDEMGKSTIETQPRANERMDERTDKWTTLNERDECASVGGLKASVLCLHMRRDVARNGDVEDDAFTPGLIYISRFSNGYKMYAVEEAECSVQRPHPVVYAYLSACLDRCSCRS